MQQKHAVARAVEAFQQPVVEPQPVKDQGKLKADMNGNLSPLQDARINRDVVRPESNPFRAIFVLIGFQDDFLYLLTPIRLHNQYPSLM